MRDGWTEWCRTAGTDVLPIFACVRGKIIEDVDIDVDVEEWSCRLKWNSCFEAKISPKLTRASLK